MGLLKNQAIPSAKLEASPSSVEVLWLEINGRRETVKIGYPKKGAETITWPVVEGTKYKLTLKDGEYVAMPIKDKGKAIAVETEQPIKLDPLAVRLTQWFNFGSYAIVNDGEGWKTLKDRISPAKIWNYWNDPNTAIGLRFGKTTRYGLIDLDTTGHHHNEADLRAACEALETIGIYEPFLKQSSNSGGWHLYYGFPQDVPTFALSCAVQEVLARFGFDISPGNCEIFPNRKGWTKGDITHYNGARLPLQPGSGGALLNDDLVPYSTSIETFLDLLDESAAACDIDLLLEACAEARANYSPFAKPNGFGPHSKKGSEWRKADLATIAQPWEPSISMKRLGIIARYGVVFERLTGDDLVNFIVQTAIATPDYKKYCQHQHELTAWACRWGRCAERKYYPYEPKKQSRPTGPTNEEKTRAAMRKIADAVVDLIAGGKLPDGVKARERLLVSLTGTSKSTLWKSSYRPLWHPAHMDSVLVAATQTQQGIEAVAPDPRTITLCSYSASPPSSGVSHKACGSPPNSKKSLHPQHVLPPRRAKKTKTTQTQTQQGIQKINRFEVGEPVPISRRLAIVNQHQSQSQQRIQPPLRIVNRPVSPIADPNPNGVKPGDWVVEVHRPRALLRLESIDPDGEYCRCADVHWGGRELCLLSELNHAPPDLVAEYLPNGDRHQSKTS
ncbi:hypothetical protein IQ217_18020 [Synechocystis salina LEGE 00031]|uniref:DNA primase/polymerase bifunctional N-terminal domain-containing protein n=2 Tax=Synechocystis TaxID=1142 RepID=A0ABR9VXT7_9SYNC|nr:hypothetical protein [Synechocystis salina]MBE9255693.1 hypothetical protein [Synechocystis salina LEGE 00031]